MPFGRVFETLAWGRRHVVMGANQIDPVRQPEPVGLRPIAASDTPDVRRRGRRATPSTMPRAIGWVTTRSEYSATRSTWCPESVGTRSIRQSGISLRQHLSSGQQPRRVRLRRPRSPYVRFHSIPASNLTVRANTSFEVHGLDGADRTRLATGVELNLIRERIDPKALRDKVKL